MPNPITILWIPAGFSQPAMYDDFRAAVLSTAAARAQQVDMVVAPYASSAPPHQPADRAPPSMYDDVEAIVSAAARLCDEDGRDVVVVAHSYTGTPLAQATADERFRALRKTAGRRKGGVARIAFCTCIVPPVGKSAGEFMVEAKKGGGYKETDLSVTDSGWLYYPTLASIAAVAFSDLPPAEGEAQVAKFGWHSARAFADPLTAHPRWRDWAGNISYLLCERDESIPPAVQRLGIARMEEESGAGAGAGAKVDVTSIQADHVPTVSRVAETVDWVLGVAAKAAAEVGRDD